MIQWKFAFQCLNLEIDTKNEPHSDRFIKADCLQLKQIIVQDRNAPTRTSVLEFNVYRKPIINAMKRINLTFKFNRWMHHELNAEEKLKRKIWCLGALRYQKKVNIPDKIVTCNEKWVYYNNTNRKNGVQHLENQ